MATAVQTAGTETRKTTNKEELEVRVKVQTQEFTDRWGGGDIVGKIAVSGHLVVEDESESGAGKGIRALYQTDEWCSCRIVGV